jgi:sulfur carrier protein
MKVTVNGKDQELPIATITELLRELKIGEEEKGFAVAVNEEVIFRSTWQNAKLHDRDRVEIIRATQGG